MEKATSLFQETQHIMGGEPYDGGPGTCKAHPDIHSAKHPMQFLQAELGMRDYQARRETTSAPDFWPTPCQPPQNGLFSISYQNTPKHFPARKHWHFGVVFTTIISHWEPCGASYRPQSEGLFPTIWAKLSTLWWVIFSKHEQIRCQCHSCPLWKPSPVAGESGWTCLRCLVPSRNDYVTPALLFQCGFAMFCQHLWCLMFSTLRPVSGNSERSCLGWEQEIKASEI